jgi:hypothetical protein
MPFGGDVQSLGPDELARVRQDEYEARKEPGKAIRREGCFVTNLAKGEGYATAVRDEENQLRLSASGFIGSVVSWLGDG